MEEKVPAFKLVWPLLCRSDSGGFPEASVLQEGASLWVMADLKYMGKMFFMKLPL